MNTSPVGNDEHGNPGNIKVSMDIAYDYDYDNYCFSFDDNLMNGMSWAPLPPATENSFSTASGTIMIDATDMIAGTYTTSLEINTVPFCAKINGDPTNDKGKHTIPVKVVLTGTNNRLPARPSAFNASPGNDQVQLTWKAPAEGLTYIVYRREGREEALNSDNWTVDNWSKYKAISGADVTARGDGTYIFVDGTAENGKTYSYVVSTGKPFRGYASTPVSATPKSTYVSRLLCPERVFANDKIGGVELEWQMNELYGGISNNGESMVDHFNVYRDGVLVACIAQNAVNDTPIQGWVDDGEGNRISGISGHEYEWTAFIETPNIATPYKFSVAAVSKSGMEGYISEESSGCGLPESPMIISHIANYDSGYYYDNATETYKPAIYVKPVISSDGDITGRISVWKSEGTSAPDISTTPYMSVEESFNDMNIVAGKTYTYTLRATDIYGNEGNYYTFTALASENADTSAADVVWSVLDGKRAHMEWSGDYYYDYDSDKTVYTSTYKVYRNGVLVNTYSGKDSYTYEDDPGNDGVYLYRVDKVIQGVTVTGREFSFTRNTDIVDDSALLKVPEAPVLNIRMSGDNPVLTWSLASIGSAVSGYHIYRKDAGEFVCGSRTVQDASWLKPYEKYWGNSRYLTINDPEVESFVDGIDQYYLNDQFKGALSNIDWSKESCPHEYWITAFNNAGESKPSKVFIFNYAGADDDGTPIPPVNDEDVTAPGKPVITNTWVEWIDSSKDDSELTWTSQVKGNIHVAWKDTEPCDNIDSWNISFDGVNGKYFNEKGEPVNYDVVKYSDVIKNPAVKKGDNRYDKADIYAESGEFGDYGRTVKISVTAVNTVGETKSDESEIIIYSLPRSRAFAENGSVKLEWTDLFNDDTTVVNSWKIQRKSEYGSWETIRTFAAGEIAYAATDANGVKSYMYRDSDVTNGWEYQYKVTAVCADGIERPGTVISVTPDRFAATEKPGVPTDLKANVVAGAIMLSWNEPALTGTPSGYYVYKEVDYGLGGGLEWLYEGTAAAPSTQYIYRPESAGKYKFRVYSYNEFNNKELKSDFANEVSVTVTQEQLDDLASEKPAKPVITTVSGEGSITVNWTYDQYDGSKPSYYLVERTDAGHTEPKLLSIISGEGTAFSYTDDMAESGVEYCYTVISINSYSESKASAFARAAGKTRDELTAEKVSAMIEGLPAPDAVTAADSDRINEVKEIYDGLTNRQKQLITDANTDKLKKCVDKLEYDDLNAKYGDAVKPIKDIIDALPGADDVTLQNEEQINNARNAYDAVTPSEAKKLIDTTMLVKAEAALSELKYNLKDHGSLSFTGKWVIGEDERPVVNVNMYGEKLSEENYSIGYVMEGKGVVQGLVSSSGNYRVVVTGKAPYYGRLISTDYLKVYDVNDILDNAEFSGTGEYAYTGKAIAPKINVHVNGKLLSCDKDYVVTGYCIKNSDGTFTEIAADNLIEKGEYYAEIKAVEGGFYKGMTRYYFSITEAPVYDPGSGNDDPAGNVDPAKKDDTIVGTETKTTVVVTVDTGAGNDGLGEDGTAVGKGADVAAAETAITTAASDEGPKGSTFAPLLFGGAKQTNNSVKCSWKKISGAKTYVIYGNLCGKKNKPVRLGTSSGSSFTVNKINDKKLKKGTYYKFILVAIDGNNKVVSTSKTIYAATSGGKNGNYKKITTKAKKDKVTLKIGKTFKLGAKQVASSKKLKVKKKRAVSYETGNTKVAAVSGKGVIKAVGKGSCYVYVYAQNGVYKRIRVTVKK